MTVSERIRHYRKDILGLTQEEFSKRINVSRANIASIERDRITVTDRVISDICNAFSLSEEWLRYGTGEMEQDTATTLFSTFAKHYDLTQREQNLAKYLLSMPSEDRAKLVDYILGLASAIKGVELEKKSDEATITATLSMDDYNLLQEIKAEEAEQRASASGSTARELKEIS